MQTNTIAVHFIATRRGPNWVGKVIDLRTQATLYRTLDYSSEETAKSAAASLWRAKQQPLGAMRYDDAAMELLRCCSLDFRTVRNMREHMIPALRAAGTYSPEEIERGVAEFERRVADAAQQVAA